jgi:methylmalonyl-CoA/ethylmalonyl-CoA epimerase
VRTPLEVVAFSHVGFAVPSVEEFVSTWGAALAHEEPRVHDESSPGGVVVGGLDHGPLEVTVAFTRIGGLPIELIETRRGRTCHLDWLEANGPGLHHLAFWVRDLPAQVKDALAGGFELVMAPGSLARAVLQAPAGPSSRAADLVGDAGGEGVPEFFAFLDLAAARTRWTLELLDVAFAGEYRRLNGDLPAYPELPVQ